MKVLGISQDGDDTFTALLKKTRKGIKIQSLLAYSTSDNDPNVKEFYICSKKACRACTVTGLGSRDLLIRPLRIKIKKVKDLKKTLPFQEEDLSLLPSNDTLSLPITQVEENGHKVVLFQTPKTKLQEHISRWIIRGINPDVVSCEAIALARFTNFLVPELSENIVFHLGKAQSTCVLIKDHLPLSSHSMDMGIDHFLKSLRMDLPEKDLSPSQLEKQAPRIDLLSLKKKDFPNLYETVLKFKKESAKIILSFANRNNPQKIPMILTGHIDLFPKLHEILYAGSEEIISSVHQEKDLKKKSPSLLRNAIPIGLAIDRLKKDSLSVQFRQKEFLPPSFFKRMGRKLCLAIFLAIAGSISLIYFTHKATQQTLSSISEQIDSLYKENPDTPRAAFDQLSLEDRITFLEEKVLRDASPFPFFLKVPNVSQFLAWINTLPDLPEAIDLRSYRYVMESLPTIKDSKAPYNAKVTLTFTSSIPDSVEHVKKLLQSNPFISDQQELSWSSDGNCYEVSFYLNSINNETYTEEK